MGYLSKVASAAGILALMFSGIAAAQVSKEGMGKVLPVHLYACEYVDGKGSADLDKVVARWSKYADDRNIDNYAAWTLTPYHYGPEQDFDVIWMGAFADGNAMGSVTDDYLNNAVDIQNAFRSVMDCDAHLLLASAMYRSPASNETPASGIITMMDCELNEGSRYPDIRSAEMKWAEYLTSKGSKAGYWHWFPVYGGGDAEYDYKVVYAYTDYKELGSGFELIANGGGRETSMELFGDIDECDDARVYIANNRRAATLR